VPTTLTDNYFTIMAIIATLYIGLLAFMYPRIIDCRANMQDKFVALHKKFSEEILTVIYLPTISLSLFLVFVSIGYSVKTNACCLIIIYINIALATIAIIINFIMAKRIEKYLFDTDKLHKKWVCKIDFSKDLSDDKNMNEYLCKLHELKTAISYFVCKDVLQEDQIGKHLYFLEKMFWKYIAYLKQNASREQLQLNNLNNIYYEQPLKTLSDIGKLAIDKNQEDIYSIAVSMLCEIQKKFDYEEKAYLGIYSSVVANINELFVHRIRTKSRASFQPLALSVYASEVLDDLIKVSLQRDVITNLFPQNFLFYLSKEIIDAKLSIKTISEIFDYTEANYRENNSLDLLKSLKRYEKNSSFDILSYWYFRGEYKELRGYAVHKSDISMQCLVKYVFVKEKSIVFDTSFRQNFDEYTKSDEYKRCILLLALCLIKQKSDNFKNSIKNAEASEFEKQQLDHLLEFDIPQNAEIINLLDKTRFKHTVYLLDKFFANKELLNLFDFPNDMVEYREFIIEQLKRIAEKNDRKTGNCNLSRR